MERNRLLFVFMCFALVVAGSCSIASAVIFPKERGDWPADWPKELEPLRATSSTLGVHTGLQEAIHEIPVADRQSFETIWPAVRKLVTPGATLTLYRKGAAPPLNWGRHLSNERAALRLYAPTGGYASKEAIDPVDPPEMKQMVGQGRALSVGPPWPESIVGESGELPEYVVAEKGADGRLTWVAADWRKDAEKPRGFYHRARIDVDLVVDGEVIDLNRVELPKDVRVVDRRFGEEME